MKKAILHSISQNAKKTWIGKVSSKSSTKTLIVFIEEYIKHPIYGKYMRKRYKYSVHDEIGCEVGDKVKIAEIPPISKTKSKVVLERIMV